MNRPIAAPVLQRFVVQGVILLLAAACLLASPRASANPQTFSGDLVQIKVSDDLTPDILVKPSTASGPADPYVRQYYCDGCWTSVLHVDGTVFSGSYASQQPFTPVRNVVMGGEGWTTISTTVAVGTTGLQLTQLITHVDGERAVTKEWRLSNTGSTAYTGLRFFHGGDAYFGGDDFAWGYHDAASGKVYLRNSDAANWGLMSFQANPATPAASFFEGDYIQSLQHAIDGQLPGTVNPSWHDAGYQLQWNRDALAPGETWTIQAFESWTPAGGLQVLAPGTQNAAPGTNALLSFTIQNLTTGSLPVDVAASASLPSWTVAVQGATSFTLPANGSVAVPVAVSVPASAIGSAVISLDATGTGPTTTASATLDVVDVSLEIGSDPLDFGEVAAGASATRQVSVTNRSGGPVTLGALAAAPPFSLANDTCSKATLANSASCMLDVSFAPATGGAASASLSVPVVAPAIVLRSAVLAGTGVAAPAAITLAASAVTLNGATLNGTVSDGGGTTSASFAFGTTASYGNVATASPATVSPGAGATAVGAVLSGLACNTTYHFRVTGTNVSGTASGADATFATPACPVLAVTPAGLAAGTYGVAYNQNLSASGGTGPYAFSVIAGALPPGLVLSAGGTLSGMPSSAGSYSFTVRASDATAASVGGPYTGTLVVSVAIGKAAQAIVFGAAPAVSFLGTGTVSATGGGSGNAVTFTSLTPGVCAISGSVVSGLGSGTCTIAADQAGNANFAAAPRVTLDIGIGKASQSITWGATGSLVVGGTGSVSATASSGLAVAITSLSPAVCSVAGSVVTGLSAGTCTLAADQAGNAGYNAAARATASFPVAKASQSIAFGAAPALAVGASATVSASGGRSSSPVTFASLSARYCTMSGTTVTGVAAGTCTIAANQAGDANYTAAPQATISFPVSCDIYAPGDCDNDGIPNAVELLEGRNPLAKDNDIFSSNRLFVMQQFRDFLGHEGDAGGVAYWQSILASGAQSRGDMVATFFDAPEHQNTVPPLVRLYLAYFNRTPDYEGLRYWSGQYAATGSLAWISDLFAQSVEFRTTYGPLDNGQFVNLVYQNILGRPADAAGFAFWKARIDAGTLTRGQLMLAMSESPENVAASAHDVFVATIYASLLHRVPDNAGFAFWAQFLDAGNSRLSVISTFITSQEYHDRFLP